MEGRAELQLKCCDFAGVFMEGFKQPLYPCSQTTDRRTLMNHVQRFGLALVLSLSLAACDPDAMTVKVSVSQPSPAATVPPEPQPPVATTTATTTATATATSTATASATQPEQIVGCGSMQFDVYTYPIVDTDGDGKLDHLSKVQTSTIPEYRLVGPSEIEVEYGHAFSVSYSIRSFAVDCGIALRSMLFAVYDYSEGGSARLKQVNDIGMMSTLSKGDGTEFADYAADNMNVTPTGNELHYIWQDGQGYSSGLNNMPTQYLTSYSESVYTFMWGGFPYMPSGTTFNIALAETFWTDMATGQRIEASSVGGLLTKPLTVTVHVK